MLDLTRYVLMEGSSEDVRFGLIDILFDPSNPEDIIFCKKSQSTSREDHNRRLSLAQERQALSSPYILKMLRIDYDDTFWIIKTYFKYPNNDYLARAALLKQDFDELLRLIHDLLCATAFLEKSRIVHGDLRPEYICFDTEQKHYMLIDRLGDYFDPTETQIHSINRNKLLFMSPVLFNELMRENAEVSHNPFKSESFSVGMLILNVFAPYERLQSVYNFETKSFDSECLGEVFKEIEAQFFGDVDSKMIAEFVNDCLLNLDEKSRMTPRKALHTFRETIWKAYYKNPSLRSRSKTSEFDDGSLVMTMRSAVERESLTPREAHHSSKSIQPAFIQIIDEAPFMSNKQISAQGSNTEAMERNPVNSRRSKEQINSQSNCSKTSNEKERQSESKQALLASFGPERQKVSNGTPLQAHKTSEHHSNEFQYNDSFGANPAFRIFNQAGVDSNDVTAQFNNSKVSLSEMPAIKGFELSQTNLLLDKVPSSVKVNTGLPQEEEPRPEVTDIGHDWDMPDSQTEDLDIFKHIKANENTNTLLGKNFGAPGRSSLSSTDQNLPFRNLANPEPNDEIDFLKSEKHIEGRSLTGSLYIKNRPHYERMNSNDLHEHKDKHNDLYLTAEQRKSERLNDFHIDMDNPQALRISAPFPNQKPKKMLTLPQMQKGNYEYDLSSPISAFSNIHSINNPSEFSPKKSAYTGTEYDMYSNYYLSSPEPEFPSEFFSKQFNKQPVEQQETEIVLAFKQNDVPRKTARKFCRNNAKKMVRYIAGTFKQNSFASELLEPIPEERVRRSLKSLEENDPPSPTFKSMPPRADLRQLARKNTRSVFKSTSKALKIAVIPEQLVRADTSESSRFTFNYSEISRMQTSNVGGNTAALRKASAESTPLQHSSNIGGNVSRETLWNVTLKEGAKLSGITEVSQQFPDTSFAPGGLDSSQGFGFKLIEVQEQHTESRNSQDVPPLDSKPISNYSEFFQKFQGVFTAEGDVNGIPSQLANFSPVSRINEIGVSPGMSQNFSPSHNQFPVSMADLNSDSSSMFWYNIPIAVPGMSQITNEKNGLGEIAEQESDQHSQSDLLAKIDKQIKLTEDMIKGTSARKNMSIAGLRTSEGNMETPKADAQRLSLNPISKSPSKFKLIDPDQMFELQKLELRIKSRSHSKDDGRSSSNHSNKKETNFSSKKDSPRPERHGSININSLTLGRTSLAAKDSEPPQKQSVPTLASMHSNNLQVSNEPQPRGPASLSSTKPVIHISAKEIDSQTSSLTGRPLPQPDKRVHPTEQPDQLFIQKKQEPYIEAISGHNFNPPVANSHRPSLYQANTQSKPSLPNLPIQILPHVVTIIKRPSTQNLQPQFLNTYIVHKPYELRNLSPTPSVFSTPNKQFTDSHKSIHYHHEAVPSLESNSRSPVPLQRIQQFNGRVFKPAEPSSHWVNAQPLNPPKLYGHPNSKTSSRAQMPEPPTNMGLPLKVSYSGSTYYPKPPTLPQTTAVVHDHARTSRSPMTRIVTSAPVYGLNNFDSMTKRHVNEPFYYTHSPNFNTGGRAVEQRWQTNGYNSNDSRGNMGQISSTAPMLPHTKIVEGKELFLVRITDGTFIYRYKEDMNG